MMTRRQLQFNALRAFEAAARHASVSGAARELAVTHSAVSHQLKQLELQLGGKLFERTNRGLKITAAGEMLLPVLSESFDRITTALDQFSSEDRNSTIQVTSTPSFASKWLVPRLSDWYAHTGVNRIHLQPSLELLDLQQAHIDFAIRCGSPPWGELVFELLMPIHLVPVCSPEYAARKLPLEQAADVLNCDLIHADVGDQGPGEEWCDWLQGCGIECSGNLPGLSVKDPALAMQAAADGLGLAVGYLELIDRDLHSGKLVIAFDHLVKHRYCYYLVYHPKVARNPALLPFRDWLMTRP
jgi:LysR family glycine cleavage system transcriptional activator